MRRALHLSPTADLGRALPPNGLAIYAGGGELAVLEPPVPLRRGTYVCGGAFAVEPLLALCEAGNPVGVIVIDGAGCIVGVADGVRRTVLRRMTVNLPHKHARGGQSAARFGRLADEARAAYVARAAETIAAALGAALSADAAGTAPAARALTAVVVVGCAETKARLVSALPPRLRALVTAVEDAPYGGDAGFAFGCRVAEGRMSGCALEAERAAVAALEAEVALDRGRYVLGEAAVVAALKAGAVAHLLVGEDAGGALPRHRSLRADELVALATARGAEAATRVSERTPEGARFCRGLTGVGALLRWAWLPPAPEDEGQGRGCGPAGGAGGSSPGGEPPAGEDSDVDFM